MPVSLLRLFTAALLLVSFSAFTVPAQQTKRNPEEKPRKVRKELKKAYVDWIDDVDPILTQSERDAWKKLQTDELTRLIDTRLLEPGESEIQIRIRDQITGQTITPSAKFRVIP